jgi:hypothetical protein
MSERRMLARISLLLAVTFLTGCSQPVDTSAVDGVREYVPPKPEDAFITKTDAQGKITDCHFVRMYFVQSKGKDYQVEGINIHERIFILKNESSDGPFDITVRSNKTQPAQQGVPGGWFEDYPGFMDEANGLPDTFHVKVERVLYVRKAGGKVPIGTGTYEIKREAGDGPDQIRDKSSMTPNAPRDNLDAPEGTIETKDSGD